MTLRKTITLLSSLVILTAIVISDVSVFLIYRKSAQNEALQAACLETNHIRTELDNYRAQLMQTAGSISALSAEDAQYFFKVAREDMTILTVYDRTVYNNTGLEADEILSNTHHYFGDFTYYEKTLHGNPLLIVQTELNTGEGLLHLYNYGSVRKKLLHLAAAMAVVSFAVTAAAICMLRWILSRALRPVEALSQQARAIADGAYDERAEVVRQDEVGQLAADFNQMAEAVQAHIRAVEDSEQRKTMFMGSLTHELKTPLTAISGYAQTLRAVALSPEDEETALRYIDSESRRLDRLAKKMMRLLELDRETELTFTETPVPALAEDAVRICQPIAEKKQITLIVGECAGTLACERELMTDVLVNLIDNAIRASDAGAEIALYARNGVLTVEDHGCGIPADEIDKITEPFYMVDKSRSRRSGGAGLGLAITAQILRLHGITLTVESELHKGTRMNLHFVDIALNT